MKFTFEISKTKNLYLFIAELSQWNKLTCFPQRKKVWLRKIGGLSKKGKVLLKNFSNIMQWAENNLEDIFLFEKTQNIWKRINHVNQNDAGQLHRIFQSFEKKFNLIWQPEKNNLQKLANIINKQIKIIKPGISLIQKLCGIEKEPLSKNIKLNLLLSCYGEYDCQGFTKDNIIILECSNWPLNKIVYLLNMIILHEIFHILLKGNKKLFLSFQKIISTNIRLIKKSPLKSWPSKIVFEEALISSFLPEGYLSEKFLNSDVQRFAKNGLANKTNDLLTKLRFFCALNLYTLAKKYIEEHKTLDNFYFSHVISNVKDFIKK